MARDSESPGISQSKRPSTIHFGDNSDQVHQQTTTHTHRVKSQKHIVGGGASRLHARVPSSKGLHKSNASASTAKLNRRHGASLSPERGNGLTLTSTQQQHEQRQHHHRRATSELKLTARESSLSNLLKNVSATNLKRNRSQADVGKKTKSTTSLHQPASNPAVDKPKSSGSSKVHFDLGNDQDDDQDDEWVDASTSASPLLSRRGSTISGNGQPANPSQSDHQIPVVAPPVTSHQDDDPHERSPTNKPASNANNLSRNTSFINTTLTSKVLARVPSHGAPPKMSTETVSVRPSTSLQQSSAESSVGRSIQARPGSSGKTELTSRFLGHNSQEPGSEGPVHSYMLEAAANSGGLSRAALTGTETTIPRRPRSMGSLSHAQDALRRAGAHDDSDEHGDSHYGPRNAPFGLPREPLNRTQQKLDLQRASSDIAQKHPYGILGYGPDGMAVGAPEPRPWSGLPRPFPFSLRSGPVFQKAVDKTGLEWRHLRRYQHPVYDSIQRIKNFSNTPYRKAQNIPQPSRSQSRRSTTEQFIAGRPSTSSSLPDTHHEHEPVAPSSASARRPFSSLRVANSAASSYGTDDGHGESVGARMMREHHQQGLSGSSLMEAPDRSDPEVKAILSMMWANPNDRLTASQG